MSVRISTTRACDRCRQSKRRCLPTAVRDGSSATRDQTVCVLCAATGEACTFVLETRPRGPSKAYVQRLESQVKELEESVRNMSEVTACPVPDSEPIISTLRDRQSADSRRPPSGALPIASNRPSSTSIPRSYDPGESDRIKLAMSRLSVTDFPFRYHGSSSLHHVSVAIDSIRGFNYSSFLTRVKATMRREFWVPPVWDVTSSSPIDIRPFVTWPHPALEHQLVNTYFDRIDLHLPLLEPTTFREKLSSGLANRDRRFSAVCWLVFANAARFIDEPTTQYSGDPRSSGWAYFLAAKEAMANAEPSRPAWLPQTPDDVSLQVTVLTCTWLHGTVSPHLAWLLAGSALRATQELGLHIRDHTPSGSSTSADQHVIAARRAFWCLYHLDISHCASGGRRPVFSEGDFDFDPPLILYHDAASSAFIQKLLLDRILGQALDKLYGVQPGSVDDIGALLDATEHWLFALPSFLRLPSEQSISSSSNAVNIDNASMIIHYHYVRLLIRRPLLPRHRDPPLEQEEALYRSLIDFFAIVDVLKSMWRCNESRISITSELMYSIWTAFAILHLSLELAHDSPSDTPLVNEEHFVTASAPSPVGLAERTDIVTRMDACTIAMSDIERRWQYAGKLTDWVSESMRSLCERFGDTFGTDLHDKWSKSTSQPSVPAMGNGDISLQQYQPNGSCDIGGPADAGAIDYDLILEQLFGVIPWSQA